jgi:hypothetical protein
MCLCLWTAADFRLVVTLVSTPSLAVNTISTSPGYDWLGVNVGAPVNEWIGSVGAVFRSMSLAGRPAAVKSVCVTCARHLSLTPARRPRSGNYLRPRFTLRAMGLQQTLRPRGRPKGLAQAAGGTKT